MNVLSATKGYTLKWWNLYKWIFYHAKKRKTTTTTTRPWDWMRWPKEKVSTLENGTSPKHSSIERAGRRGLASKECSQVQTGTQEEKWRSSSPRSQNRAVILGQSGGPLCRCVVQGAAATVTCSEMEPSCTLISTASECSYPQCWQHGVLSKCLPISNMGNGSQGSFHLDPLIGSEAEYLCRWWGPPVSLLLKAIWLSIFC